MKVSSGRIIRAGVIGYASVLTVVSLLPSGAGRLGGWDRALTPTLQNVLHVPAYALLAALVLLAVSSARKAGAIVGLWVALGCCAYGAMLECLQALIPGRTGSVMDVLLNAAGVVIGVKVALVWARKTERLSAGAIG